MAEVPPPSGTPCQPTSPPSAFSAMRSYALPAMMPDFISAPPVPLQPQQMMPPGGPLISGGDVKVKDGVKVSGISRKRKKSNAGSASRSSVTESGALLHAEEQIKLCPCIKCINRLKKRLVQQTKKMCNEVVATLKRDDPAIMVQIIDLRLVHAALGLPEVPTGLQQGATPEDSAANFRNWLIAQAHSEHTGVNDERHQYGGTFSLCWHHLSETQALDILLAQWQDLEWACGIQHAIQDGIISDRICLVLKMMGTGPGHATLFEVPKIFG